MTAEKRTTVQPGATESVGVMEVTNRADYPCEVWVDDRGNHWVEFTDAPDMDEGHPVSWTTVT